jgi:RNA polymerase sigma-70 factor
MSRFDTERDRILDRIARARGLRFRARASADTIAGPEGRSDSTSVPRPPTDAADERTWAGACAARDSAALRRFADAHRDLLEPALDRLAGAIGGTRLTLDALAARVAEVACADFLAIEPVSCTRRGLRFFVERLQLDDLALALACAAGCDGAWTHFERSYGPFSRAVVASVATSRSDADEIASSLLGDLFLAKQRTAGGGLAAYGGRARLTTWIRAVVHFKAADYYEAKRRAAALAAAQRSGKRSSSSRADLVRETSPEGLVDRRERLARLESVARDVIASLDEHDRFLVDAYYVRGETLEAIGASKGVHKASVSRWMTRLRGRLMRGFRRRLGPDALAETDEQFWSAVGREFRLRFEPPAPRTAKEERRG